MANGLGVASAVITSDKFLVLGIRSNKVDNSGNLSVPGGHPEPSKIGIVDVSTIVSNEQVCLEIFNSCVEEINLELRKWVLNKISTFWN